MLLSYYDNQVSSRESGRNVPDVGVTERIRSITGKKA
jgi:hypothetical protein